jgi:hypothetical protein
MQIKIPNLSLVGGCNFRRLQELRRSSERKARMV